MEGGSAATIDTITGAATTAFTDGASEMMSMIATIVPIALGVVIAVMVVVIGVKVFKKLNAKT